jgi:hypothetical protein
MNLTTDLKVDSDGLLEFLDFLTPSCAGLNLYQMLEKFSKIGKIDDMEII